MGTTALLKEDRVEVRIRPKDKSIIEKAAAAFGLSVSAFMIMNALKAAQENVATQNRIVLSQNEWNAFMKVMEHPPKPNKALSALANKHKKA